MTLGKNIKRQPLQPQSIKELIEDSEIDAESDKTMKILQEIEGVLKLKKRLSDQEDYSHIRSLSKKRTSKMSEKPQWVDTSKDYVPLHLMKLEGEKSDEERAQTSPDRLT